MMYHLKQITSHETFAVRGPVLRPGKPLDACIFEGDDLPSTIHLGIFDQEELMGIVSIFNSISSLFNAPKQFQLRGMAVIHSQQKKGLGEQLILAAEDIIKQREGDLIWFNAREAAVEFYRKMGYEIIGNPFLIADIGPHYVMFKNLR